MARLEDLTRGATVKGILPDGPVTVVDAQWHGSTCVELTYKDAAGRPHTELLFRDREPSLEIVAPGGTWSFEADGALLRLVSEAYRIRLAHLFDPLLAVHTSMLEPLPHQITAVYGEMLPRQPLRFLLADDPGAGKTIMAGLLIKELRMRGDVHRCLIVCPGNLVEQWQDEMRSRFQLDFEPITRHRLEEVPDAFARYPLVICRLDQLSRNEVMRTKLSGEATDWDLVIVDEAHKMSAHFFGGEVKETKRYKLGQLVGRVTRHFLLLTATPHNGKEEDFQLFMALLDADRFEGRFRDGVHVADPSDLMRRLIKEQLLKFDGTPLFPERWAYTVNYRLSDLEAQLYREVTEYVRDGMNRAERLAQEGEGRRGNLVGWALTILQRRLASSPHAIAESLRRRRERLERRLEEARLLRRGAPVPVDVTPDLDAVASEDPEDLEDAPAEEVEVAEEELVDQASAARTITELEAEIADLTRLETLAQRVRRSGTDKKWEELSRLLQDAPEMVDRADARRKLVIFTEHRDTLTYLAERIQTLLGRSEAIVTIHGGMGREERRKTQLRFTQDKDVQILVATDAAGEGINLQRAHLMVNYDLPWNPNRLEQRFGRIHRIGQTEVCHLWNLVAAETREGEVFHRLLEKIAEERQALGGQVFDVLGKLFQDRSLRELLIEAIRYGEQPEVKARLLQAVENAAAREHIQGLLDERALVRDVLDASKIRRIREDMERAEARRLQPHFIRSFFLEAFRHLGGALREREPKRYEVSHVPATIRSRDRQIGWGDVVLRRYERIAFDKEEISVQGKPLAEFVCPGHPLLDATIDLILERHRHLLRQGAVLVDPTDAGQDPRALFYLEHEIQDGRTDREGHRRAVSKQLQFVELTRAGAIRSAGYAPYLDYRPLEESERAVLEPILTDPWVRSELESQAISYAVEQLVPGHFTEVRAQKETLVQKAMVAVKDRLTKEINYWDHRANVLADEERAGRVNARLNSAKARQRADELQARLERRLQELEQERRLSPRPPVVVGGTLVVPVGLLERQSGKVTVPDTFARDRDRVERLAMDAVMEVERRLGRVPRDVHKDNHGYDVESSVPGTGRLLFLEVKGRMAGARTITVTKNEILTGLNKPDEFILAVVSVDEDKAQLPVYVRRPFQREPDFGVTSVNYALDDLLARAEDPR